jgi:hypothetical protein
MRWIITSAIALITQISFAQDNIVNTTNPIKPIKGDWAFEVGTNLNFNGSPIFSLNDGLLQNVFDKISNDSNQVNTTTYPLIKMRRFVSNSVAERYLVNLTVINTSEGVSSTTNFGLSLGYGKEKHFKGTKHLSTYIGWDFSIAFGSTIESENSVAGFGLGVRGITGMDYYIVPKLYLGMEFGMGLSQTICGSNPSIIELNIKPMINPVLRLGYRL